MKNSSVKKDTPSLSREEVIDKLNAVVEKECGVKADIGELVYCSWPELFGNTSGPFNGIGGRAMTTFRMEAWVWEFFAVVFCNGKIVSVGPFQICVEWRKR